MSTSSGDQKGQIIIKTGKEKDFMTISSITTSKSEVRYAKCCTGPKNMIMLPGVSVTTVLDSAAAVETAYEVFNGQYTIYLFEYPRGEYPAGAEIEYIADMLAESIGLLGLEHCYLIGVSFGGMIGQILLAKYPKLFVSAVLGSTAARLTKASLEMMNQWNNFSLARDVRALNQGFFELVYSDEYQEKFAEPIRNALDNGNENDCRVMAIHTGMMIRLDLRAYDRKIKTPTLVIGSRKDRVFSIEEIAEVAHLIGCKLYLYDEYGHAVYDEAPDYKGRILEHFSESEKL